MLRLFHLALIILVFLSACTSFTQRRYSTPGSTDPSIDQSYPTEVAFELLGVARGEACADLPTNGLAGSGQGESRIGGLYEEAKFNALESVAGADNLIYVRTKATRENNRECVVVIGHAYRAVRVHSRPAVALGAGELAPPAAAVVPNPPPASSPVAAEPPPVRTPVKGGK